MSEPRGPQPPHRPGPPGRDRAPATPQNEPSRTPLPKDTVEALRAAGGAGRCSNLSLALNRLNDAWGPGFARLDDRLSRKFLQDCTAIPQQDAARRLHQDYLRRHEAMLDAYQRGLWRCLRVRGRLVSRFISGLGLANPLEVNLVLHRIGGFPYLPASSVKGAVRTAAEEIEGPNAPAVRAAFGPAPEARDLERGALIFFDALPAAGFTLGLDVMTPHFSRYYTGQDWPADWQSPNPITFLTLEPGAELTFAVAVRREHADLLGPAERWLHAALEIGVGAKTSSGYGRFEVVA